jgi:diguanylate cyclase (GGDEF)-like protein
MFKNSFKNKIISPAIGVLIVLALILISYTTEKFLSFSSLLINEKVATNINYLRSYIDDSRENSREAAISMAFNPEAVKAIKNRDRNEILRIFTSMSKFYRITYFTITDEKGIVLMRTYDPDNFGDDLTKQQNIKDALKGKISTYFEDGTAIRISARTGAPVYDADGTLIGVVSAGIRFDTEEAVYKLKEHLRSEVTIFFEDTRIVTTLHGERGESLIGTKIDPEIGKIVSVDKKEYSCDMDILGKTYRTFYMPLLDSQGKAFATIFIGTPMSELKSETHILIRNLIIIGFAGIIVTACFLYLAISLISKPLIILSKNIDDIKEGNLNIAVQTKGNDEISNAGKSLQMMLYTLQKLVDEINCTISEHEKGNTDYSLDAKSFSGDYQLLVNRIAELSNIGMRDRLTGIPNRHAFDNRLTLEWNRAMREKTQLSFLMLDVDKFKAYNDTYGHQQGDKALTVIAKTLTTQLKRGLDFAARWGGEEFAILLPNTDMDGAMHIAEQIRAEVEKTEIPDIHGGSAKKVTASIGVNTEIPSPENSIEKLISNADAALYQAKKRGRNRVFANTQAKGS